MEQTNASFYEPSQILPAAALSETLTPVVFLSHAEPFIVMDRDHAYHKQLQVLGQYLSNIPLRGVIVVSSRYVSPVKVRVTSRDEAYDCMHDHGYEQYYALSCKVRGSCELAEEVRSLFIQHTVPCEADDQWGMDHAVWMPLSVIFAKSALEAIPVVQVSMVRQYDRFLHEKIGAMLHIFRAHGYLIMCVGGITGNPKRFYQQLNVEPQKAPPGAAAKNTNAYKQFVKIVHRICVTHNGKERWEKIKEFEKLHYFSVTNQYVDDFMALYVAIAAAQDSAGQLLYHELFKDSLSIDCIVFEEGAGNAQAHKK